MRGDSLDDSCRGDSRVETLSLERLLRRVSRVSDEWRPRSLERSRLPREGARSRDGERGERRRERLSGDVERRELERVERSVVASDLLIGEDE